MYLVYGYDFAVQFSRSRYCIGFIGINVHCQCIRIRNTANNIAQDCLSAVCIQTNPYNVLILYAHFFSVCRSQMDVTLCNDNTFRNFDFAFWTNDLTCTRTSNIARFPNRSNNADGTSISCREFYLICLPERAEDGNVRQGLLRAYMVTRSSLANCPG